MPDRRVNGLKRVLRPSLLCAAVLLALLATPASAMVSSEHDGKEDASGKEDSNIVPGHYIVVLKDSVKGPATVARNQVESKDGELGFVYRHAFKGYSAELSKSAAKALRNDPRVKYVDPVRTFAIASQEIPTGIERISATENAAIDIDEKDDQRVDVDVAVIDSGIDHEHPDLNVAGRTNCVPPEKFEEPDAEDCIDGTGTDDHGHGTHVGGTIGALDNGEGVVGVAPGARLWAVKVVTPGGFGGASGTTSWIVAGIDWVTATRQDEDPENDIEVANMSLGGSGSSPAFDEAIAGSVEAGVVYAVAAGNEASNAKDFTLASSPDVITVSALADYDGKPGGEGETTCSDRGPDDTLANFSNWGADVEIAAPGACILSTWPKAKGEYATASGTSMASPHVAGAAAILASESEPESKADVEAIIGQLLDEASLDWSDTSDDFYREPLLDLGDEALPVEVATGPATKVGSAGAMLNGSIEARGMKVVYWFEYGETTSYEGSTAPEELPGGTDFSKLNTALESTLTPNVTYHYRLVASGPEGLVEGEDRTFTPSLWSLQAFPTEPLDGKDEISCATAADCVAVGSVAIKYKLEPPSFGIEYSYYDVPGAFRYDNGEWERLEPQNPGGKNHVFEDVHCPSASWCMGVGGSPSTGSASDRIPWTQFWDGETWTVVSVEIPADTAENSQGKSHLYLSSVSCVSTNSCIAVGKYPIEYPQGQATVYRALTEAWDGEEWQVVDPPSENVPALTAVSCPQSGWCMAAGGTKSLTLEQSEGEWSGQEATGAGIFTDVSCAGATRCVAVSGKTAQEWYGGSWHAIDALPISAIRISCPKQDWCLAGGHNVWNGEEWNSLSMAAEEVEKHGEASVRGVSCLAAMCTGVSGANAPQRLEITTVTTEAPTGVTSSSATLKGTVDAHWAAEVYGKYTNYQFEYGATTAYGSKAPASPKSILSGGGDVEASQSIFGLEAGTTYHFRLVATGPAGAVYGEDMAFTAPGPPTAITQGATEVGQASTTLNATVDPNGAGTTYQFEYGPTEVYGSKVPASAKSVGSGGSAVAVSEPIEGLEENSTYHFRVVATNSKGTSKGSDKTFTTLGKPPAETWNIDSSIFSGEASFSGGGNNFTVEMPELGVTIACDEEVSGTIYGYDHAEFTSTLTGCSTGAWQEVCEVAEPVTATFEGNVGEPLTPDGKQFAFELVGAECPYTEFPLSLGELDFSLDLGSEEEVDLPVTMSAGGAAEFMESETEAIVSSPSEWRLAGAKKGHVWNFGGPGEPPADTWNIDGSIFSGEEWFGSEGSLTVEIPYLGLTITCDQDGLGTIKGYAEVDFTGSLSGCSADEFEEVCTVSDSGSATFQGDVSGPLNPSGQFAIEFEGEECPVTEFPVTVAGLDFGFEFGSEAVKLPVTMSAEGLVDVGSEEAEATVSSTLKWYLAGAVHWGDAWGFH